MRSISRFAVDTHMHISTLYMPAKDNEISQEMFKEGKWNGLRWEVEHHDNIKLALYDMDRYGIDMGILLPSIPGTLNEHQYAIVEKYPDRFRACCSDQTTRLKVVRGEIKNWNFQMSLDEVDEALKTGHYVGIGEFAPGLAMYDLRLAPVPSFEERREQYKAICDLGVKYDVPVHYHDHMLHFTCGWDTIDLLEKICLDNPKAKILFNHGYKDPYAFTTSASKELHKFYSMAAGVKNLYLETGGWAEKHFEIAFDEGVRACYLMWGHDYGNVPQHIVRPGNLTPFVHDEENQKMSGGVKGGISLEDWYNKTWSIRKHDSRFCGAYRGFSSVPTYQPDFYGWGLRTIDRIGDWLTQDEINLIMGGTAARLYKLPVPLPRMFPEARPDIFGDNWEEEWYPFIPDEQIQDPEGFRIPVEKMVGHDK